MEPCPGCFRQRYDCLRCGAGNQWSPGAQGLHGKAKPLRLGAEGSGDRSKKGSVKVDPGDLSAYGEAAGESAGQTVVEADAELPGCHQS